MSNLIFKIKFVVVLLLIFSFCALGFSEENVFSADEFLHLSLVASGCDELKIEFYEGKIKSCADDFLSQVKSFSSDSETAENALTFLYQVFLKSYSQNQTRIDTIIDTGKYNCVSSSVLFMYMMKRCGIECVANETTEHAFCTVIIDGKKIDVETTNPYGFEPGKKKQVSDNRYYKVPAKNYNNRKVINDSRLVALIYGNRIAELQKKQKSLEAFPLAVDAAKLQSNSLQSVDLINKTAANIIAEYVNVKNYDDAILFARNYLSEYAPTKEVQQNLSVAISNKIEKYTKQNDFDGGMQFLETQKDILAEGDYSNFERMILVNGLNYSVKADSFETSSEKIKSQRDRLSKKDFSNLISTCYSKETDRISKQVGFYEAYLFASSAAEEFPGEQSITKLVTTAKQNYAVQIHNQVVPLVNSKRYDEAKAVIEDAIGKVGDVPLLKNDLKKLQ